MRLSRDYRLTAEQEEPLRRTQLKGIGAVTLVLVFVAVAAFALRPQTGTSTSFWFDLVSVGVILMVVRSYSIAGAVQRLELGRKAYRKGDAESVIASLAPFLRGGVLNTQSRFDRTGEAHYLLAWAAKRLGEKELLAYCKTFLARFRKGEWAKKALKL